jgi:NADH-quinone oxidoreductase subunit L
VPAVIARIFRPLHALFFHKWYFDELYDLVWVRSCRALGRLFWVRGDQGLIDGAGPRLLAATTQSMARALGDIQTGYVFHYAFVMMAAVIALVTWIAVQLNVLGL